MPTCSASWMLRSVCSAYSTLQLRPSTSSGRSPAAPGQPDEAVGVLVLDRQGRLVQLNEAARKLLCVDPNSVILGHPVLTSQSGLWPLGTQSLTDELRPLIDKATAGERQTAELR